MIKKDLTTKKRLWSSDNVIVIRRRPKAKPTPVKPLKAKAKKKKPKKSEVTQKAKPKKPASVVHKSKLPKKIRQFRYRAINHMNKILPEKPYKIGITKDLFNAMKNDYPGKRTWLRLSIKFHMRRITKSEDYLKALAKKPYRHSLNGTKYTISKEHRKKAKELLTKK